MTEGHLQVVNYDSFTTVLSVIETAQGQRWPRLLEGDFKPLKAFKTVSSKVSLKHDQHQ